MGEVCEDIRTSGLLFPFRKFEFDSKSNFVMENLMRYRNFRPAFLFRKFQFDSKSNSVCIGYSGLPFSFRNFQFENVEIHVILALWCRFVYPLASISLSLSKTTTCTCKRVIWFVYLTQFDGAALSIRSLREREALVFPANSPNFPQLSGQPKFSLLTIKQSNWTCRRTGA